MNINESLSQFFKLAEDENIEIYNEFSLQHELGIFLRNQYPDYKIQFERNISYFYPLAKPIKKEIDIVIFNDSRNEKYAIELKFPRNGQHPEQMYSFVKDLRFMEQLKQLGFNNTYCVTLVDSRPFYEGLNNSGIYKYFRSEFCIYGEIFKPTGSTKNIDSINIDGIYNFEWIRFNHNRRYYIVEV